MSLLLTPNSYYWPAGYLHLAGTEKWCCPERRVGAIRDDNAHLKCKAGAMDMAAAKGHETEL
jgi:hypothetical protein